MIAAGHDVVDCETVASATSALRTGFFDLILADLWLGDGDCMPFLNFASYASPAVKIIAITGSSRFPYGEIFQQCGNLCWMLRKPVSVRDLVAISEYTLRSAGKATGHPSGGLLDASDGSGT